MWKLNSMQQTNQWVNEEIQKYLENNKNRKTMVQNLWGAVKAAPRGKFTILHAYLKKQEKSHLTLHLKKLEREE